MRWNELVITTLPQAIEPLCGLLYSCGAAGFQIDYNRDIAEFIENKTDNWDYVTDELLERSAVDKLPEIRFYLAENEQGQEQLAAIRDLLADLRGEFFGELTLSVTETEDSDWNEKWREHYHPITVNDKLTIVPSWQDYEVKEGEKILRLDPKMAFGTGDHPTTMLALRMLADQNMEEKSILDVGCGSGVLAICAAKLGASKVLATDFDLMSVKITEENFLENGVEKICSAMQADLTSGVSGIFDIVVANIVADIILRLLPSVQGLLAEDGKFICSGIIDEREEELEQAFSQQLPCMELVEKLAEGSWRAYMLQRK